MTLEQLEEMRAIHVRVAPGASEDERFDAIDPSVEPGPPEVVLGTRVMLPDDVHCTLADGSQASSFVVTGETARACSDASGAPIALLPLHASSITLSNDTPAIQTSRGCAPTVRACRASSSTCRGSRCTSAAASASPHRRSSGPRVCSSPRMAAF